MKEYPEVLLSNTVNQEIEQYGQISVFQKGDAVFSPEKLLEHFFVILKGRIKVSQVELQSGKEQILKIMERGDMYDVVALLDGELHENILTALDDDTQILCFPMHVVRNWIFNSPNFNKVLFPYIAKQMRDTEELATDLSLYSTPERLMKLIVKNIDPEKPNRLKLIHDLPHEEIAAVIGTVRKVLNRHIQELKAKGVIDVERKNIILKDPTKFIENTDE